MALTPEQIQKLSQSEGWSSVNTTGFLSQNQTQPSWLDDFNSRVGYTPPKPNLATKILGTEEAKPGYFSRLGTNYVQAGEEIKSGIQKGAEQVASGISKVEHAPTVGGKVAGGLEALGGLGRSALRTVGTVAETAFSPITEAVAPVIEPLAKKVVESSPFLQESITKLSDLAKKYPEYAKDVKNVVDIATLFVGGAAEKPALATTSKLVGKGAAALEKGLAEQSTKEAMEIIKPILTKTEKGAALKAGRGTVSQRILPKKYEQISLVPTKTEEEMAKVVSDVVSKGKNPVDNIKALETESLAIGEKIRTGLKESDAIWNKNELKNNLSAVEKPITVKSDAVLDRQAINLQKGILQLAEDANKKAEGILDLRLEFDNLVNKEFPNLWDKEMTPIRQYISNIRKSLNTFAEEKLPNGKLSDGTYIKDEWRKQHLMLEAKSNIAEKVVGVVDVPLTRRVMDVLRKNVLVYGLTGGILTFGAMKGLFSNPIMIGALITGGTFMIGKSVVTSRTVRQALVYMLRALEKVGKTADAGIINSMIKQLPE